MLGCLFIPSLMIASIYYPSFSFVIIKVGEIERTNRIISGLSIHTLTELKIPIPSSSPQPSPNTSPSSARRHMNHSKMNGGGDHQKRLSTSTDNTGTSPPSTGMGTRHKITRIWCNTLICERTSNIIICSLWLHQ